jgi:hypothetical protein
MGCGELIDDAELRFVLVVMRDAGLLDDAQGFYGQLFP